MLHFDDEPSVLMYLETLLQDNGYDTVTALNGRVGFEKAKTERPDLICLDITMPEESGIRFFRNLKESPELLHIPVMVVTAVTGYGGDPTPFENFLSTRKQVPASDAFFSKPIVREELVDEIACLLALR